MYSEEVGGSELVVIVGSSETGVMEAAGVGQSVRIRLKEKSSVL